MAKAVVIAARTDTEKAQVTTGYTMGADIGAECPLPRPRGVYEVTGKAVALIIWRAGFSVS